MIEERKTKVAPRTTLGQCVVVHFQNHLYDNTFLLLVAFIKAKSSVTPEAVPVRCDMERPLSMGVFANQKDELKPLSRYVRVGSRGFFNAKDVSTHRPTNKNFVVEILAKSAPLRNQLTLDLDAFSVLRV